MVPEYIWKTFGESIITTRKLSFSAIPRVILILLLLIILNPSNSHGFPCVYDSMEESNPKLGDLFDSYPQCVLKVQTINRAGRIIPKDYVRTNTQEFANIIYCVGVNMYSVKHFKYPLHFRLECVADYPVEFEFFGLKPVDDITTYFSKIIVANSSRKISSYKVDIDFENKPKLTGSYVISSIANSSLKSEFYFFMESNKEPFLLHFRKTEEAIINNNHDIAVLPCRSSNWNITILLYKIKRERNEIILLSDSVRFDPKLGFIFNLTKNVPEEGQYLCVVDKGKRAHGDSFPVSLILTNKMLETTLTKIDMDFEVVKTGALCSVDNFTHEFRPKSLINIKIANPTQAKLQKECVFQGEYCLNTDQRVGGYESSCMCLAIHQLVSQGIAMCKTEDNYIIQEYFTGLDGRHYCDSTQVQIPNYAVIKVSPLNATKAGLNVVYNAYDKYAFQCDISGYLLVKPIVWYRKLNNGDLIEERINYDRGLHNREVWTDKSVIEICPETVEILCAASFWNNSVWVNSSMSVHVSVRRKPIINGTNPTILNFTLYEKVSVVCTAEGYPTPELTWLRNSYVYKRSYIGRANLYITKKSLELKFNSITSNDSGNYTCVAKNDVGTHSVNYVFNVFDSPIKSSSSDWGYQIAIRVPLGILICVGVVVGSYLLVKHRKRNGLTRKEIKAFEKGTEIEMNQLSQYAHDSVECQPYNKNFEIHDNLHLEASVILGSGAYGIVLKGKYRGQSVAIKTVKAGAEKMYLMALLSELKIMIHIGQHPHVINFLGAKTNELHKGMLYIVVEYCPMGNLENVLRNQNRSLFVQHYENEEQVKTEESEPEQINLDSDNSHNSPSHSCGCDGLCIKDLVLWSYQIASAMEYLTSKKVIHGDLAARNVLLLNREIAKVTDFGLSRKLYDYLTYVKKQQEPLPWRWLAIEALQSMNFSSKSDVWSYGITLWEIFSLGDIPYPGLSWCIDFASQLEEGLRLMIPKYSSYEIYSLMQLCWAKNPEDRPSFSELKKSFYLQLVRLGGDKYVELEVT